MAVLTSFFTEPILYFDLMLELMAAKSLSLQTKHFWKRVSNSVKLSIHKNVSTREPVRFLSSLNYSPEFLSNDTSHEVHFVGFISLTFCVPKIDKMVTMVIPELLVPYHCNGGSTDIFQSQVINAGDW